MPDDPRVHQEADAGRDSFSAARDVHVHQAPPSSVPAKHEVWGNVPARNPGFTGRESLLAAVHDALSSGDRAVVQALHGMGGVGKTQLAIEYAHRHAGDYEVVWWLNCETPALLGEQFAALAAELSYAPADAPLDAMRRAVLAALHERDRWLLIFDNAENPDHIASWLPGGTGHVLITSRYHTWHELAVPVEVDVFSRAESIATLCRRVPHLSERDADRVAAAVGDLPLAVAQAAGYMALTDIPPDEYVRLLDDRPAEILDHGKPWSYPRSLAAATILSLNQMRSEDPAAAEVVAICAFLAPEPVPIEWFPRACAKLPEHLGERAADAIAWRQVIARLRGSGLVRVSDGTLLMHRLIQAVIRGYLSGMEPEAAWASAVKTLIANEPGDWDLPASWPAWATMLPHVLALDPANSDDASLRGLAMRGTWYLIRRGDAPAAVDLARHLHNQWHVTLGMDHRDMLKSANVLAAALGALEEHQEARALHEDTLARCRRLLGEDDPETLWSANNLSVDLYALGEYEAARGLDEDVLARRRRLLGEDHPSTLVSANNLAGDLRALGEYQASRDLYEDTLARRRRVLGEDHPNTQRSIRNLAEVLRALGEE